MAAEVERLMNSYKVVVVSKSFCPYCKAAKKILDSYSINVENIHVLEIDERPDEEEIMDFLEKIGGTRTVPKVIIGGEVIGGADDTANLHNTGELKKKLEAVNAI